MVDAPATGASYPIGRRVRLGALGLTLLLAACAQTTGTAVGVVTAVDGTLTEVTSFTVLSSGVELVFAPLDDVDYEFPLVHLSEHLRTGEPVVVGWELDDDGNRYATSLADG